MALKNPEITSSDPLFRPVVILECGHEVQSDGQYAAHCPRCSDDPRQARMNALFGIAVANCPIDLDVCYGSCFYWSLLQERCSFPAEGAKVDANISGERDSAGDAGEEGE